MKPKLTLIQIDAFTRTPYGGNPCAVVFDADDLSAEAMQTIAREMNLSETAFVLKSDVADVRARYFTPGAEVPLAGHPTIATIHALTTERRLPFSGPEFSVRLQLEAGVIEVGVSGADSAQPRVSMTQLPPTFGSELDPAEVLPAFGLRTEDCLPGAPVRIVSTGTPQLMIPVRSLETLKAARPDPARFEELAAGGAFFSAHLFVCHGVTGKGDTFARHFVPPPTAFEDPFTGSATGAMGAYLWKHGLIAKPSLVAEQGHGMLRPGVAEVEVTGPPDAIEAVTVSGYAAEVMRAEIMVP